MHQICIFVVSFGQAHLEHRHAVITQLESFKPHATACEALAFLPFGFSKDTVMFMSCKGHNSLGSNTFTASVPNLSSTPVMSIINSMSSRRFSIH